MRFEVDLWDVINAYATSVGGDPSAHVYGNTARMLAVAAVARVVDQVSSWRQIDDITIEELAKGGNAAAARACELTTDNATLRTKIVELERDHVHLKRLYAESRDYVGALERERDALVEASRRDVAEIDRLDAEVEALRKRAGA